MEKTKEEVSVLDVRGKPQGIIFRENLCNQVKTENPIHIVGFESQWGERQEKIPTRPPLTCCNRNQCEPYHWYRKAKIFTNTWSQNLKNFHLNVYRTEEIERNSQLRTKATREAEIQKNLRRYRYALIRVRFPDGILLQGIYIKLLYLIHIHDREQNSHRCSLSHFNTSGAVHIV